MRGHRTLRVIGEQMADAGLQMGQAEGRIGRHGFFEGGPGFSMTAVLLKRQAPFKRRLGHREATRGARIQLGPSPRGSRARVIQRVAAPRVDANRSRLRGR